MLLDREPAEQLAVRMDAAAGEAAGTALARHESRVTPAERAHRLGQQPATLWITGLAGAGKTELAYEVERRLFDLGAACVVLDGENVRLGLSRGLDFSAEGRAEHLRRAAETARLLNDAGLIAVCAFLSPTRDTRRQVAERVGAARYLEIHLDAPVAWCEARDTRGLYAAARRGEGHALAGVTMPYEPPEAPALAIAADRVPLEAQAAQVIELLRRRGVLRSV
jgi:adenylyl-sulfate kinase